MASLPWASFTMRRHMRRPYNYHPTLLRLIQKA
ncbi:hypothetical protein OOU_Y34scaffold00247g36 [Pyricularia oryzae Y34]|uniref:Uncharacterized protein n=2 Tax=Pyricularia oryzae TaxID=318829 RepID=A0AA97PPA8_PYRO3|nr:hypothetical protein OOU_Y34scaffold00247g36 [Pyricularia oryzae Y34]